MMLILINWFSAILGEDAIEGEEEVKVVVDQGQEKICLQRKKMRKKKIHLLVKMVRKL